MPSRGAFGAAKAEKSKARDRRLIGHCVGQVFLREQLIAELEEKQKMIEAERYSMELTGDSMDLKPITTRKLRRRANESASE